MQQIARPVLLHVNRLIIGISRPRLQQLLQSVAQRFAGHIIHICLQNPEGIRLFLIDLNHIGPEDIRLRKFLLTGSDSGAQQAIRIRQRSSIPQPCRNRRSRRSYQLAFHLNSPHRKTAGNQNILYRRYRNGKKPMRTAHMPESLTEWRDIGFRNPQTPAAIRYTDNIDQRVYGSNFVEMNLPHRNPVRFRFRVCNDTKDTECHLLHLICSFHLLQNWTNLLALCDAYANELPVHDRGDDVHALRDRDPYLYVLHTDPHENMMPGCPSS